MFNFKVERSGPEEIELAGHRVAASGIFEDTREGRMHGGRILRYSL
jgi:hypothetical protein